MVNLLLYARVSTDEQAEKGSSIPYQKDRLYQYCELVGYNVVQYYAEDYSAKSFDNRPEWNKILIFLKANKGLITKILVVRWDRFSRNAPEAYQMIKTLNKLGVEINAIEQPIDFKIPEQKMLLSFYLTIPEIENDRRSMNTSNGMRKNMKQGRFLGVAPFGFKNSRDTTDRPLLTHHSEIAPLVKKAFEMFATGLYQIEVLRKELYKAGLKVSRNQFWLLLRNPIYCGKLKIKAYGDEPEEIVLGIHEPIVTEELFYEVQDVLAGKKKITTKYARVNDEYPMRGFMVCSKCGKNLTGSSSKGNGGTYYYYHCTKGCNERFKSNDLHNNFYNWLSDISFKPEVGSLYLAVMEDVFKTNEGDRDTEIKKFEAKLAEETKFMDEAARSLVKGDLDKFAYNRMKENNAKTCANFRTRIAELKSADSGFKEYTKYNVSLMSNLKQYYSTATLDNKQKMLGLMFPEKLVFTNKEFQTTKESELLTLLCNAGKGFSGSKKEKSSGNAAPSYLVTASGFKPETF